MRLWLFKSAMSSKVLRSPTNSANESFRSQRFRLSMRLKAVRRYCFQSHFLSGKLLFTALFDVLSSTQQVKKYLHFKKHHSTSGVEFGRYFEPSGSDTAYFRLVEDDNSPYANNALLFVKCLSF